MADPFSLVTFHDLAFIHNDVVNVVSRSEGEPKEEQDDYPRD